MYVCVYIFSFYAILVLSYTFLSNESSAILSVGQQIITGSRLYKSGVKSPVKIKRQCKSFFKKTIYVDINL